MSRRVWIALLIVVLLSALPAGLTSAQEMPPSLDLPPGVAAQAEPLLMAMMDHMQQMGMSPEQMEMMMADMRAMVGQLPPGIFLELLRLMPQLGMEEIMALHQQMHEGDLLQQPSGQILSYVQKLVR
jgi:hypothetical protein